MVLLSIYLWLKCENVKENVKVFEQLEIIINSNISDII